MSSTKTAPGAAPRCVLHGDTLPNDGCSVTAFGAGDVLQRKGARSTNLVELHEGLLALVATDREGQDLFFSVRGPGAVLNLEALADQTPIHDLVAVTDGTVCRIPVASLERKGAALPETARCRHLLELTVAEIGRYQAERICLGGRARQRVARLVLLAAEGDEGCRAVLEAPQHVIARTLDVRPETLSRVAKALRSEGAFAEGPTLAAGDLSILRRVARLD